MFADDTNLFIEYSPISMNNLLSTLEKFSETSGLKINFEKSVAYCIGVKPKNNFKTNIAITWSDNNVETLGIKIPLWKRKDIYGINYEPKIASMEAVIRAWSMRNLSLRGKVTVIKSLLISKFQYLIAVLGIPDKKIIVRINKSVYKFLWDGSEKLKRNVMINAREEGGMEVPDFEATCKSVMIKWIYRYLHAPDSKWKQMVDYTLSPVGGSFVFKCNLSKDEIILKSIQSMLWRDVVTSWCDLKYCKTDLIHLNDVIWLNSNLGEILYNKSCIENGLLYLNQFVKNGSPLSLNDLCNQYNIRLNIIDYYNIVRIIKGCIPQIITNTVKEEKKVTLINTIMYGPGDKSVCRKVYYYFIRKKAHYDSVHAKWANCVNIEKTTKELFDHIEKVTIVNKLRSFHFKFLHRILFFNDKLFKFQLVNTSMCDFCNENID